MDRPTQVLKTYAEIDVHMLKIIRSRLTSCAVMFIWRQLCWSVQGPGQQAPTKLLGS